jgi:DNA-binding NarL/FixJ family response regulator
VDRILLLSRLDRGQHFRWLENERVKKSLKKRVTNPVQSQARKRVFIVEDHPVFREGLVQVINRERDLEICGQAGDAEGALKAIIRQQPDLVLVDISLPGKNGLVLIKELRKVNQRIKLLVVSMHDEALYANRVLRAGGDGYIMKQEDPEEVVDAIRDVLAGHIYVSEEVLAKKAQTPKKSREPAVARPLDELSDTQLQILECLGLGKDNTEIARNLKISPRAIGAEVNQIRSKLKFKTDNELIRYAVCWVEAGRE